MAHRSGILSWYDHHISTGKLEGINNKLKTMKRQAYGYRDEKFFELKVLLLYDKNYAFSDEPYISIHYRISFSIKCINFKKN